MVRIRFPPAESPSLSRSAFEDQEPGLSSPVAKVWLIVRKPDLAANMSRYLVERITATPNIEILTETTVTALDGQDGILEAIRCHSHRSGDERKLAIRHLFLFNGADPNTDWLKSCPTMPNCVSRPTSATTSAGCSNILPLTPPSNGWPVAPPAGANARPIGRRPATRRRRVPSAAHLPFSE
jgi:hypothetical protein